MRDPSKISAVQARILELAWKLESITASDVQRHVSRLSRTTAAVTLGRMEKYGWLGRERSGRGFAYRSAVSRLEVRRAQVGRVLHTMFPEDLPGFFTHALREGDWTERDLEEVQRIVEQYREERRESA